MPKALERKLAKEAVKKGFKPGSDRYEAYIWGTMRRTGWVPSRERKGK